MSLTTSDNDSRRERSTKSSYQHSRVFAELKQIKEKIGTNLSSYQYLSTLDTLLYRALYPLVSNTNFVEHFLAKVLVWQTLNPKRKASNIDHGTLAKYVTLFLLASSTDKKMQFIKKCKFDRAVIAELIRRWSKAVEPYAELADNISNLESYDYEKEKEYEIIANLKPDRPLLGPYRQSIYWLDYYQKFKDLTIEKYTRMCLTRAKQDYVMFDHRVPLDDVIQIYLFNASKAIDKCDTEKGVLTTHISNWLLNARNSVQTSNLTGTAYSLPKNSKNVVERLSESNSVSLDDIEELYPAEAKDYDRASDIDRVREVAKLFDPKGFGRLSLGLTETLSKEDRQTITAHSIKTLPPDAYKSAKLKTVNR